ncbi:MAG: hypothetical protein AB1894_24990 [Chloroflexota bacterium]
MVRKIMLGKKARIAALWVLAALLWAPACQLFNPNASLQETLVAVRVQQTMLVQTDIALTDTALTSQAESTLATTTVEPLQTPSPTPALPLETPLPVTPEGVIPDLDRRMKAARILLFENMSASGYVRYVKEALDRDDYFYLDVGSATGWFKSQLLSATEWDLVITAAEARRDFGGDYFEMIDDRVENGAAAIIEYWDLDTAPQGKVSRLLTRCGVQFQADWQSLDPSVFYWLHPNHPIFNEPHQVPSLHNAASLWSGDIGDLMAVRYQGGKPVGDATILASTNPAWQTDHGTLVSCMGGRMILQTFSSHNYQANDVIQLWQNYIYQVLKSRFAVSPSSVPTPVERADPTLLAAATPLPEDGPLPEIGSPFHCGAILNARLLANPSFQRDLFEHHAKGTFLVVELEFTNLASYPVQIWNGDYLVEGELDRRILSFPADKASTGYLFIQNGGGLYQDVIQPGERHRTQVSFDVDPLAGHYTLLVRPGFEFDETVCELRIPLTR